MIKRGARIVHTYVQALEWPQALSRISSWAARHKSRYVCFCNVDSVITADQDSDFKYALDKADMTTPDGAPVAWMLGHSGFPGQQRINGPDFMWKYCEQAATRNESIFLVGCKQVTLNLLTQHLTEAFPGLKIAGTYSPPFRQISAEEDEAMVEMINESGAGTVWVSLGCPKQEIWMAAHRGRINAVMLGVGAAFAYHAGTCKRAPLWMQHAGLEWLYRLSAEPSRLWKRYLVTNTLFLVQAARQLISTRRKPGKKN
jgi:N-acetylglucosaminyldiphosphoundecaprenol N-acetyl-beta-D-mannosaminyltransferase